MTAMKTQNATTPMVHFIVSAMTAISVMVLHVLLLKSMNASMVHTPVPQMHSASISYTVLNVNVIVVTGVTVKLVSISTSVEKETFSAEITPNARILKVHMNVFVCQVSLSTVINALMLMSVHHRHVGTTPAA